MGCEFSKWTGDSKLVKMPVLQIGLTLNTIPIEMPAGIWGTLVAHCHRRAERQGQVDEENEAGGPALVIKIM